MADLSFATTDNSKGDAADDWLAQADTTSEQLAALRVDLGFKPMSPAVTAYSHPTFSEVVKPVPVIKMNQPTTAQLNSPTDAWNNENNNNNNNNNSNKALLNFMDKQLGMSFGKWGVKAEAVATESTTPAVPTTTTATTAVAAKTPVSEDSSFLNNIKANRDLLHGCTIGDLSLAKSSLAEGASINIRYNYDGEVILNPSAAGRSVMAASTAAIQQKMTRVAAGQMIGGRSALHTAICGGFVEIAFEILNLSGVERSVTPKRRVVLIPSNSAPPTHATDSQIIKLTEDIDLNMIDDAGESVLHAATRFGYLRLVKLILFIEHQQLVNKAIDEVKKQEDKSKQAYKELRKAKKWAAAAVDIRAYEIQQAYYKNKVYEPSAVVIAAEKMLIAKEAAAQALSSTQHAIELAAKVTEIRLKINLLKSGMSTAMLRTKSFAHRWHMNAVISGSQSQDVVPAVSELEALSRAAVIDALKAQKLAAEHQAAADEASNIAEEAEKKANLKFDNECYHNKEYYFLLGPDIIKWNQPLLNRNQLGNPNADPEASLSLIHPVNTSFTTLSNAHQRHSYHSHQFNINGIYEPIPKVDIESLTFHSNLINVYNTAGWTSLHVAIQKGYPKITQVLLQYGGDVSLATSPKPMYRNAAALRLQSLLQEESKIRVKNYWKVKINSLIHKHNDKIMEDKIRLQLQAETEAIKLMNSARSEKNEDSHDMKVLKLRDRWKKLKNMTVSSTSTDDVIVKESHDKSRPPHAEESTCVSNNVPTSDPMIDMNSDGNPEAATTTLISSSSSLKLNLSQLNFGVTEKPDNDNDTKKIELIPLIQTSSEASKVAAAPAPVRRSSTMTSTNAQEKNQVVSFDIKMPEPLPRRHALHLAACCGNDDVVRLLMPGPRCIVKQPVRYNIKVEWLMKPQEQLEYQQFVNNNHSKVKHSRSHPQSQSLQQSSPTDTSDECRLEPGVTAFKDLVNIKDSRGLTVLDCAATSYQIKDKYKLQVLRTLVCNGADIEATSLYGSYLTMSLSFLKHMTALLMWRPEKEQFLATPSNFQACVQAVIRALALKDDEAMYYQKYPLEDEDDNKMLNKIRYYDNRNNMDKSRNYVHYANHIYNNKLLQNIMNAREEIGDGVDGKPLLPEEGSSEDSALDVGYKEGNIPIFIQRIEIYEKLLERKSILLETIDIEIDTINIGEMENIDPDPNLDPSIERNRNSKYFDDLMTQRSSIYQDINTIERNIEILMYKLERYKRNLGLENITTTANNDASYVNDSNGNIVSDVVDPSMKDSMSSPGKIIVVPLQSSPPPPRIPLSPDMRMSIVDKECLTRLTNIIESFQSESDRIISSSCALVNDYNDISEVIYDVNKDSEDAIIDLHIKMERIADESYTKLSKQEKIVRQHELNAELETDYLFIQQLDMQLLQARKSLLLIQSTFSQIQSIFNDINIVHKNFNIILNNHIILYNVLYNNEKYESLPLIHNFIDMMGKRRSYYSNYLSELYFNANNMKTDASNLGNIEYNMQTSIVYHYRYSLSSNEQQHAQQQLLSKRNLYYKLRKSKMFLLKSTDKNNEIDSKQTLLELNKELDLLIKDVYTMWVPVCSHRLQHVYHHLYYLKNTKKYILQCIELINVLINCIENCNKDNVMISTINMQNGKVNAWRELQVYLQSLIHLITPVITYCDQDRRALEKSLLKEHLEYVQSNKYTNTSEFQYYNYVNTSNEIDSDDYKLVDEGDASSYDSSSINDDDNCVNRQHCEHSDADSSYLSSDEDDLSTTSSPLTTYRLQSTERSASHNHHLSPRERLIVESKEKRRIIVSELRSVSRKIGGLRVLIESYRTSNQSTTVKRNETKLIQIELIDLIQLQNEYQRKLDDIDMHISDLEKDLDFDPIKKRDLPSGIHRIKTELKTLSMVEDWLLRDIGDEKEVVASASQVNEQSDDVDVMDDDEFDGDMMVSRMLSESIRDKRSLQQHQTDLIHLKQLLASCSQQIEDLTSILNVNRSSMVLADVEIKEVENVLNVEIQEKQYLIKEIRRLETLCEVNSDNDTLSTPGTKRVSIAASSKESPALPAYNFVPFDKLSTSSKSYQLYEMLNDLRVDLNALQKEIILSSQEIAETRIVLKDAESGIITLTDEDLSEFIEFIMSERKKQKQRKAERNNITKLIKKQILLLKSTMESENLIENDDELVEKDDSASNASSIYRSLSYELELLQKSRRATMVMLKGLELEISDKMNNSKNSQDDINEITELKHRYDSTNEESCLINVHIDRITSELSEISSVNDDSASNASSVYRSLSYELELLQKSRRATMVMLKGLELEISSKMNNSKNSQEDINEINELKHRYDHTNEELDLINARVDRITGELSEMGSVKDDSASNASSVYRSLSYELELLHKTRRATMVILKGLELEISDKMNNSKNSQEDINEINELKHLYDNTNEELRFINENIDRVTSELSEVGSIRDSNTESSVTNTDALNYEITILQQNRHVNLILLRSLELQIVHRSNENKNDPSLLLLKQRHEDVSYDLTQINLNIERLLRQMSDRASEKGDGDDATVTSTTSMYHNLRYELINLQKSRSATLIMLKGFEIEICEKSKQNPNDPEISNLQKRYAVTEDELLLLQMNIDDITTRIAEIESRVGDLDDSSVTSAQLQSDNNEMSSERRLVSENSCDDENATLEQERDNTLQLKAACAAALRSTLLKQRELNLTSRNPKNTLASKIEKYRDELDSYEQHLDRINKKLNKIQKKKKQQLKNKELYDDGDDNTKEISPKHGEDETSDVAGKDETPVKPRKEVFNREEEPLTRAEQRHYNISILKSEQEIKRKEYAAVSKDLYLQNSILKYKNKDTTTSLYQVINENIADREKKIEELGLYLYEIDVKLKQLKLEEEEDRLVRNELAQLHGDDTVLRLFSYEELLEEKDDLMEERDLLKTILDNLRLDLSLKNRELHDYEKKSKTNSNYGVIALNVQKKIRTIRIDIEKKLVGIDVLDSQITKVDDIIKKMEMQYIRDESSEEESSEKIDHDLKVESQRTLMELNDELKIMNINIHNKNTMIRSLETQVTAVKRRHLKLEPTQQQQLFDNFNGNKIELTNYINIKNKINSDIKSLETTIQQIDERSEKRKQKKINLIHNSMKRQQMERRRFEKVKEAALPSVSTRDDDDASYVSEDEFNIRLPKHRPWRGSKQWRKLLGTYDDDKLKRKRSKSVVMSERRVTNDDGTVLCGSNNSSCDSGSFDSESEGSTIPDPLDVLYFEFEKSPRPIPIPVLPSPSASPTSRTLAHGRRSTSPPSTVAEALPPTALPVTRNDKYRTVSAVYGRITESSSDDEEFFNQKYNKNKNGSNGRNTTEPHVLSSMESSVTKVRRQYEPSQPSSNHPSSNHSSSTSSFIYRKPPPPTSIDEIQYKNQLKSDKLDAIISDQLEAASMLWSHPSQVVDVLSPVGDYSRHSGGAMRESVATSFLRSPLQSGNGNRTANARNGDMRQETPLSPSVTHPTATPLIYPIHSVAELLQSMNQSLTQSQLQKDIHHVTASLSSIVKSSNIKSSIEKKSGFMSDRCHEFFGKHKNQLYPMNSSSSLQDDELTSECKVARWSSMYDIVKDVLEQGREFQRQGHAYETQARALVELKHQQDAPASPSSPSSPASTSSSVSNASPIAPNHLIKINENFVSSTFEYSASNNLRASHDYVTYLKKQNIISKVVKTVEFSTVIQRATRLYGILSLLIQSGHELNQHLPTEIAHLRNVVADAENESETFEPLLDKGEDIFKSLYDRKNLILKTYNSMLHSDKFREYKQRYDPSKNVMPFAKINRLYNNIVDAGDVSDIATAMLHSVFGTPHITTSFTVASEEWQTWLSDVRLNVIQLKNRIAISSERLSNLLSQQQSHIILVSNQAPLIHDLWNEFFIYRKYNYDDDIDDNDTTSIRWSGGDGEEPFPPTVEVGYGNVWTRAEHVVTLNNTFNKTKRQLQHKLYMKRQHQRWRFETLPPQVVTRIVFYMSRIWEVDVDADLQKNGVNDRHRH